MSIPTTQPTQIPFEPIREKLREAIEKYKENHPEKCYQYEEFRELFDALESKKVLILTNIDKTFNKQYFKYGEQTDDQYNVEYTYRTDLKLPQNIDEPFHTNQPFDRKYSQYDGWYGSITWLKLSILLESIELVQFMLEHGASVNSGNKKVYPEYTELHFAAKTGNVAIFQLLIDSGSDINIESTHYETPLHIACACGNTEIVKILLARGAKIIAKDILGDTPLHYAAQSGNIETVKLLVKSGADIHAKGALDRKPLNTATLYQKTDVAEYLTNCDWIEWIDKSLSNLFSKETKHKQDHDTVLSGGQEAEQEEGDN